jgi:hypothetical protein
MLEPFDENEMKGQASDSYNRSPSHPTGRDSNRPPPGPNSLLKRGVNVDVVAGASSYAGLS